jgi:hypothetical protein
MNKNLLDIYSDYLIAQKGLATAIGLSQMLDGQINHNKITKFLNRPESSSKELWEYVKPTIRIEEGKKGQYQNLSALSLKDGEKRIVCLKNCAFSVALIAKVFKNEEGSTGTLYLVTNDLESSADQIYKVYKKR